MRRTKADALQTRLTVLTAAAHIIARMGVNSFTIDAVAREAGITKGGVLHHFPTKESLIEGLIDLVMESFNVRLQAEYQADTMVDSGRWLRAYIRTIFLAQYEHQYLMPALAAVVFADEQLLSRIRHAFVKSQQAAISDGLDPIQATIIRLAVDGVVFARALNIDVLDAETSQKVYAALFRLTQPISTE